MKTITFLLQTKQPVLATSFQGDPNSDVSYSYLPGSMLRGALISRYLKRHSLHDSDILQDATVRRLFFDGTTSYLNAYLFTGEKRSLPVPLSWSQPKMEELPCSVYDLAQNDPEQVEDISLKSVSQSFCTVCEDQAVFYSEQRRINIHNLRNRRRGRSVDGSGEIFRYDAIETGQTFQAVILCEDADIEVLQSLFDPTDFWLGGSQSAGYGHTQIQDIKVCDRWTEVDVSPAERTKRQKLTITLLSDLILRDQWGQTVADPQIFVDLIAARLGASLSLQQSFARSTLVGGFNRKWGLPLPQVQAFLAGSVFLFEGVDLTTQQIQTLESQSFGERIVEGFGRIAVNWTEEHNQFNGNLPEEKISIGSLQLSESSREIASAMAERLLRQKLEQLVRDQVGRFELETKTITNTQLSRLMLLARQELQNPSNQIRALFEHLPANALWQFERTKVRGDGQSFNQQILNWLNEPTAWIANLPTVTIADQRLEVDERLAREYTLRLIIAVTKKIKEEGDI
ncbi:MAG: hypothetical protein MUC48_23335 [Leptolyngbya sp. Prado105]|nr:hypothetical protein [Leptolyngbya sp. Prado105]